MTVEDRFGQRIHHNFANDVACFCDRQTPSVKGNHGQLELLTDGFSNLMLEFYGPSAINFAIHAMVPVCEISNRGIPC